jgi:single-strand DNA-binding protein
MNNLNSVLVEGNMIRDPQQKYDKDEKKYVVTFTIASNHYFNNATEKEVSFFDIETDNKLAERTLSIGKKGKCVRVVGRLRQDRFENKTSRIVIVAIDVEFRPEFNKKEKPAELDFDVPDNLNPYGLTPEQCK